MDRLRQTVSADLKRPDIVVLADGDLEVCRVQRLFPAERKMECISNDLSGRNVAKPGHRDIMGRRAETVSVGRIEKRPEQISRGNRLALSR